MTRRLLEEVTTYACLVATTALMTFLVCTWWFA